MTGTVAVTDPLAGLAQARQVLERSRDLSEVKAIHDVAIAAQAYARAQKLGADAVRYASEIVLRAERRMGEMLAATDLSKGGRPPLLTGPQNGPVTLAALGVSKNQSHNCQQIARLPEHQFERYLEKGRDINRRRLLRMARESQAASARTQPVPAITTEDGIDIRHCALSELHIEPGSADLVFTDPPYPREFLPLWSELAKLAATALRPGGLLVAYSGQYHLPEVMTRLAEHLTYVWLGTEILGGPHAAIHAYMINAGSKPLLWYSRGTYQPHGWAPDTVRSPRAEKDSHDWQQSLGPALTLIGALTNPGDMVIDPFLGAGTTAIACRDLGRRLTGCDSDAAAVSISRQRLQAGKAAS